MASAIIRGVTEIPASSCTERGIVNIGPYSPPKRVTHTNLILLSSCRLEFHSREAPRPCVYGADTSAHASSSCANSHPTAHMRPLLVVRVPPAADANSSPSASSSLPFAFTFACPCTASDASFFAPADEACKRRTRRMAHVVHTLGENVPTELMFPLPSTPTPAAGAPTPVRPQMSSGDVSRQRSKLGHAASSGRAHIIGCAHFRLPIYPTHRGNFFKEKDYPKRTSHKWAPILLVGAGMAHTSFILALWPAFLILFIHSAADLLILACASFDGIRRIRTRTAPPPTESSSPLRYDRGTPVHDVSYAVFPSIPASTLAPLSSASSLLSSSDTGAGSAGVAGLPARAAGRLFDGRTVQRRPVLARSHFLIPISTNPLSSSYAPPSAQVKFDPGVGHDGASPPSSSSPSNSKSPTHETVGYDRGNHRTEMGSGEWVTGVDGSGMGGCRIWMMSPRG
ncbi:hypothetical protein C8R44DRAFT_871674 [Mycena epipterygia]|nr:hypothetical protein C8R44DRAFT_871674 [Mycena epipterygia]